MDNALSEKQWVGVDLYLPRSVISRIDDRGELIEWVRIDNDPKALVKEGTAQTFIDSLGRCCQAA